MVKTSLTKAAEVMDTAICVRGIREYKLKKKQFLESSGIVTIEEPSGLLVTTAIVSGKDNMKDVTDELKIHIGQVKCPLEVIHVDTGKLNQFTGLDIEPGTQKLIQIEYITDDKTTKERQICCPEVKCKPKKHNKCCEEIDDTKYICLDQLETRSEKRCRNKKRHHDHCDEEPAIHHHHHHHHPKPRMSSHLYFPLYPIHGPFVTHRVDKCDHRRSRKCKNNCDDDC